MILISVMAFLLLLACVYEVKSETKKSEEKIMAKLSELTGILTSIQKKVDAIDAVVVAGGDPDLTTEQQSAVDGLTASVDKLTTDAKVPPAT